MFRAFRFAAAVCGLMVFTSAADAQFRPVRNLLDNLRARREARAAEASTSATMTSGYNPQVITVGRLSGTTAVGLPTNPYQYPSYAVGADQRIRTVNPYTGEFFTTYYQGGAYQGGNYYGGPDMVSRGQGVSERYGNRQRWGQYDGSTRRIGDSGAVGRFLRQIAPQGGSSGSGFARAQAQFNAIQAQSNARINNINAQSQAYRRQAMNDLNNYGAQLRGGMSGGGGARIDYDDNAPRVSP